MSKLTIEEIQDWLDNQDMQKLVNVIRYSKLHDLLLEDYMPEDDLKESQNEVKSLEDEIAFMRSFARNLHEAICENRQDDAICILRDMFDDHFPDAKTYANMFAGRVK